MKTPIGTLSLTALAFLFGSIVAVFAMEDWQVGHGPFVSASDVRNHNKMPLDIRDVTEAIEGEEPDWRAALEHFAFGGNFPNHSLALFTDDYNGRFATYLPVSSVHFGDTAFQNQALLSAIIGTGRFRNAEISERQSFIEASLEAVALNWARFELGESRRKATMAEPNWSLENGSPKNWNEIFAFWHGPDGHHSVFAALEGRDGGAAINAALYQALTDGQDVLVTETWTDMHAAEVKTQMDAASVLLFREALTVLDEADDAARPDARGRAAGYWLAAAEVLAENAEMATPVEAALLPDAGPEAVDSAIAAIASVGSD